MPDEPRVQELLDELLDRQATPEEVCGACPELLPSSASGGGRSAGRGPNSTRCSRSGRTEARRGLGNKVSSYLTGEVDRDP